MTGTVQTATYGGPVGSDRGSRALVRIQSVGPLAVILVSVSTALVFLLAPPAHEVSGDLDLSDYQHILVEPADRIAFASWLAVTALLLAWALRAARSGDPFSRLRRLAAVIAALAVLLAVLSVVFDSDIVGPRPPLDVKDVVVGVVLVTLAVAVVRLEPRWRTPVSVAVVIVLGALVLPEIWQTTSSIRDWDSARFVMDEIAAPAAGRVAYGDYAPQYSALLGLPIAPVLAIVPGSALGITLSWLIALQVLTIGTAVALVVRAGGLRYLSLSTLVILAPCVATSPLGYGATTYFAAMPIRLVLPVLAIAGAYAVLRRWSSCSAIAFVALGVLAGAAALNNPDFGGPVLVAVVLVVAFVRAAWRPRAARAGLVVLGAAGAWALYAAWAWAVGAPVSPEFVLVFQRIFGVAGYFNVAMPAAGLQVAVVSLFVSATVIGLVLVRQCDPATWLGRQGLLLALTGSWALLSLGYYVGRSLTSTLTAGYALQIGMVAAGFIPLTVAAWRAGRRGRAPMVVASVALSAIALVWCAGNLSRVWAPWTYLGDGSNAADESRLASDVVALRSAGLPDGTTQMLSMPSITSLMSGVPAQPVVSAPDYLVLSRAIAGLQCEQWARGSSTQVIVTRETAVGLARSRGCLDALDLPAARDVEKGEDWVSIPIRRGAP